MAKVRGNDSGGGIGGEVEAVGKGAKIFVICVGSFTEG